MLEGLEVSEVSFSKLNIFNERLRIDSEFLKKEYFKLEQKICKNKFKRLSDIEYELIHPTEIQRKFIENGLWFFRTQNIRPLNIQSSNDVYISKEDAAQLKKNEIIKYDIVITRTGANFGQTAIYNIDKKAIGSSHTFILRNKYFNQFYLATFFNTKFGRKLIDKGMYGGLQPEIAPYYISNIPIPDLSFNFQNEIERFFLISEDKIQHSKTLYTEAENILLQALGLSNWQPTIKNNNTKSFKESFLSSGRLDAEYYQPKYDEIERIIKQYKGGFDKVENICTIKTQNFQPENNTNYKYIELANIGTNGVITNTIVSEGKMLPTRARRVVKTNDVIVSSVQGSLSSCAVIPEELNNSICSTGFYVINSKHINSETLLLLFKSVVIYLMEKGCSGTILTAINNEEFLHLPLPLIDAQLQQSISEKIQQSFALQAQSKQLLEAAKKAVEIAIEESEEKAMDYLFTNNH